MRDALDRYLPAILWTLALALATWGAWIIVMGREQIPPPVTEPQTSTHPGEVPPVVADQPILEEVSADGKVRWTLYLDRIIREEGALTELSKPRAVYRFQSGEVLEVRGDSGTYDENADLLTLEGSVTGHARTAQLDFSVDRMTWSGRDSVLTASGNVELTREGITFKGRELKAELSRELARIEVSGGVEITSAPSVAQQLERGAR